MKNSEKVVKSGKKWEKELHMKIYEAPHMNFGELPRSSPGSTRSSPGSAGKRREAPGSIRSAGQRRELRK